MRIIGGQYRGRRLATVPEGLRPSSDRLRESLFGIVSDSIRDSVWVEPFVGSGAVAIEALSRGAGHAYSSPSQTPIMPEAIKVWFTILVCCPAPGPPWRTIALPMACHLSPSASTTCASQPIMIDRRAS